MAQESEIINIETLDTAKNLLGDRFSLIIKYFLEDTQAYLSEIAKGLKVYWTEKFRQKYR